MKRFNGFGIFEEQRLASREQPIIFKLDCPFDIAGQTPQAKAQNLAILDQRIRIKIEMKSSETVKDAILRGDLGIPANGVNCELEATDV